MRISINSGVLGFSGVNSFQSSLDVLHFSIEDTITDLRSLSTKLTNTNDEGNHLGEAINSINRRINAEESKKANLEIVSSKINNFLNNAMDKDELVAKYVVQEQKKFYEKYPGLRVQDINTEPSFWEELSNTWNKLWDKASDWVSDLVTNIVDWMKEHAVELIIGIVCIVVAAAIIYFTGGAAVTFIEIIASLLKTTLIESLIGGMIDGVIGLFKGESFWNSFGDGLASGFMFGAFANLVAIIFKPIINSIRGAIYNKFKNQFDKISNKFINKFESKYPELVEHLKGEINGRHMAVGGHYNYPDSNFRIIPGSSSDKLSNGVYSCQIEVFDGTRYIRKSKFHTMFPDEWNLYKFYKNLDSAISQAYKLKIKNVNQAAFLVTVENIKYKVVINTSRANVVTTVYPLLEVISTKIKNYSWIKDFLFK